MSSTLVTVKIHLQKQRKNNKKKNNNGEVHFANSAVLYCM